MATAQFPQSSYCPCSTNSNRATNRTFASQRCWVLHATSTPGGLLITEAVNISPEAVGYVSVPGIWTEEQTSAWRAVTNSVHAKGGKIFMQLWHTGRVAHPSFGEHPLLQKSGLAMPSVSSSNSQLRHPRRNTPLPTSTYKGVEEAAIIRGLEISELSFEEMTMRAARNAMRAGWWRGMHAAHDCW